VNAPLQPSPLLAVGEELGMDPIKYIQIALHQLVEYRPA
jgi:hypothetical protein